MQYVNVKGDCSTENPVRSGVPQGSVLGPLLFLIYVNDMPDIVNCLIKIFADDTKLYDDVTSREMRDQLQTCIDNLVKWTEDWQIKFNAEKCCVIHMGPNNDNANYKLGQTTLNSTSAEKDLGVYVDNELTFEYHIQETVKRANKMVGMITHFIQYKNKEIMVPLFKSLVRPILEYGNVLWCPRLKRLKKLVEDVQRRFTKRIAGMKDLEYEDRLKLLKLPSLEFRRLRGDMIEVFKIMHGFYDAATTNHLLTLNQSSTTRGHNYKLTKTRTKTNLHAHFFTNRVINPWNNLPSNIVSAETINSFKNNLDKYWEHLMYSVDLTVE